VSEELHSAAYFGAIRDFWWNADHLELCARRLGLEQVGSVLDVGSGVGHWGRLLASVLPEGATVTGIDQEPGWVEEAGRRASAAGLGERFSYLQARAEELPFEDASFDLVTCQTVLIHVTEPLHVIREMARVVRPGGLVLASEPNNRSLALTGSSSTAQASVDDLLDVARFLVTCERGQVALGLGDNSAGDLVPGLFAEAGLLDVQAWLSDKVSLMVPPYESEEQQVLVEQYAEDANRDVVYGWTRDEARRYFVAGGGEDAHFDAAWERRLAEARRDAGAIERGEFHTAGGDILYLVAGRRRG
jgi:SAM-dependent methyltransferase